MSGIAIEMFSCSGGMAEGFRRAGIHFDLVIDKDPDAIESYTRNLGHRPVQLDAHDFLRLLQGGWRPAEHVRLIVADPPCTPWSMAGKRKGLDDERDCLRATVEIIRLLRPLAYLIGNVPGLETEPNREALRATIGSLVRDGYCVADAAVLDAADYGVPQHRVRPFWFGHLSGPCLRWPAPTHGPASTTLAIDGLALKPWATVRDALSHLAGDELGKPVRLRRRGCNSAQHGSIMARPARTVGTSNLSDGNVLLDGEIHGWHVDRPARTVTASARGDSDGTIIVWSDDVDDRPNRPDEPSKTITAAGRGHNGACIVEVPHHPVSEADGLSRVIRATSAGTPDKIVADWPWDRPSTTVTTRAAVPPPGHHPEHALSLPGAVKLSEKAAAILQGFPESWTFVGKTKTARWSQIGQAMPPPLAHAVAESIARWFERLTPIAKLDAFIRAHPLNGDGT